MVGQIESMVRVGQIESMVRAGQIGSVVRADQPVNEMLLAYCC